MDNFEVSVVIPAYNVEKYIGQTIQSVIDQTFPAKEIIVVDDDSTDKTAEIIKQYPQVRYIHQSNAGVSVARNTGVDAANYKWIAFLDGDDLWLTDKLAQQKNIIQKHPELVWVAGNYIINDLRKNRQKLLTPDHIAKSWVTDMSYINYFQHHKDFGITSNVVLQKAAYLEAGASRPGLTRTQDQDVWMRVAMKNPEIGYNPEPGILYNFFREGSTAQKREIDRKESFFETLNMLKDNLAKAEKYNKKHELRIIVSEIIKGMARRTFRHKDYQLTNIILKDFKEYLSLKNYYYFKINLILRNIN